MQKFPKILNNRLLLDPKHNFLQYIVQNVNSQ